MSLEAARNLSIPDLFRVLNEKLGLEYTRLQEAPISYTVPVTFLRSEIESLETKARDLLGLISTLRNVLQPANRLPPEILSRIARDIPHDGARDAKSIIPLTHVCRYWRQSIVSASENWTLISSESDDLTSLGLGRSRGAPLQMHLDMNQVRQKPGFVDLITPYFHKIETLEFYHLMTVDDLNRTLPNFPRTMPSLRSLDLSLSSNSPDWDSFINPFGPFSPTLTHLFLYDIPLYSSFLHLRTLTWLTLHNYKFDLPLDTLLTILEENRSLEHVILSIDLTKRSLRDSKRRAPIRNQLPHLSITYYNAEVAKALISRIPLRRGAKLEIYSLEKNAGLGSLLSSISATFLGDLASTTHIESCGRSIRMLGPNGSFLFSGLSVSEMSLTGLSPLSFSKVRELHLEREESATSLRAFDPSLFPALETLAVKRYTNVSAGLSALLSTPASPSLLKTLAFLDCNLSEDFMKKLTRFVSDRKGTISAWLYRVVIVNPHGKFPSAASIRALGAIVPVVDMRFGTELPTDLT